MDYAKINELSDGIGYCQVFDACGCQIPLDKLNYAPGTKKERLANFKILARALRKNKVASDVPLEKLANSNFQANCEFLQFSFDYLHKTYPDANKTYKAYEKRRKAIMKQEGLDDSMDSSALLNAKLDVSPGSLKERTLLRSKQKNLKQQTQHVKKSFIPPPKTYATATQSNSAKKTIFELDLDTSSNSVTDQNNLQLVRGAVPNVSPPPPPPPSMSPPRLTIPTLSSPGSQSENSDYTPKISPNIIGSNNDNIGFHKNIALNPKYEEMTQEEVEDLNKIDELIKQLEHQVTVEVMDQRHLEDMVESVRVERDFYHDTLQEIEKAILFKCQEKPDLLTGETANQLISILRS
jgi:hypothetical protein